MKKSIYAVLIVMMAAGTCFSQSLFEEYTNRSQEDLAAETRTLSVKIRDTFSQGAMDRAQQKIDYHDYLANLKNILLYAGKLATYAEYEKDLKFARDNELFKGLPDEREETAGVSADFVKKKYEKMAENVGDEIDTYRDLILMGLDTCESLVNNDLSGFTRSRGTAGGLRRFIATNPACKKYMTLQDRLSGAWPDLGSRISRQLSLWAEKGSAPEDPLIDPVLTKALADDSDV